MISPISFNAGNGTNFQGIKAKKEDKKTTQENKTQKSHSNTGVRVTSAVLAALTPLTMAACSKQTKPTQKAETTTTIGQYIEQQNELESARLEYEKAEKASEDKMFEDYSKYVEEENKQQNEALIKKNGIDSYVDLDLDDDNIRTAYTDIKNVLQNLGSTKVSELIQTAGEYGLEPKEILAITTQQGGIPKLSNMALQDAIDEYPEVENAGKTEQFVAYFSLCHKRADGDLNKAVKLFTGSEQNIDNYIKVYNDLTGDMIDAIAEDDAVAMFKLTGGEF